MRYSETYATDIQKNIENLDLSGLRGKRILVTGSTGMIGSAIIDLLCCHNQVHQSGIGVYAAARDAQRAKARFEGCWCESMLSILPYEACQEITFSIQPDFIIHAAGNAHPEVYARKPVETMTVNFIGLYHMLEYARTHGTERLLYISSSEIYGKSGKGTPYSENDYGYVELLDPRSCCPASKRAAETLCASYRFEYGTDITIVRPGHIYGPTQTGKDSRASSQFLRMAAAGETIILKSPGRQIRSYCHCMDAASAILTVLAKGENGEAYNLSNRDSVATIREFAQICAQVAGTEIAVETPTAIERAGFNRMENSSLNAEKLESLGWRGVWSLKEGIEESVRELKHLHRG